MREGRTNGRRVPPRGFRPALENARLESRLLLAHAAARTAVAGPSSVGTQVAHGGAVVRIGVPDGKVFIASLYNLVDPITSGGTIRAYGMPGGRVGLIVYGTNTASQLSIDPAPFPQRKGTAHTFASKVASQSPTINIGAITVVSGQIFDILGYHTADLSGPIVVNGSSPVTVDRIAFNSLQPGASIQVNGTVNSLDIASSANLSGGSGINIAQDLNELSVLGNMSLTNGASFHVGRDMGLTEQPPKGTAPGGATPTGLPISGTITGNLTIGPGSSFVISRNLDLPLEVQGQTIGASRVSIAGGAGNFISLGGFTP